MIKKKAGIVFLIMGVSGTGKSSIGEALAKSINAKFIDGDDLHPKDNILKMSSGYALNDNDRFPWLERIRDAVFSIEQKNENAVIVCSALKKIYRDKIREGNQNVVFIHLSGDFELVRKRVMERQDHFMPVELLMNQYETIEQPSKDEVNIVEVNVDGDFNTVLNRCINKATIYQQSILATSQIA